MYHQNRSIFCSSFTSSKLIYFNYKNLSTTSIYNIQECYKLLNIPEESKQDAVRQAFLDLVKKYHPDSGSPEADMEKFVAVEGAFRTLSKHNTGKSSQEEIEKIVYDIRVLWNCM